MASDDEGGVAEDFEELGEGVVDEVGAAEDGLEAEGLEVEAEGLSKWILDLSEARLYETRAVATTEAPSATRPTRPMAVLPDAAE